MLSWGGGGDRIVGVWAACGGILGKDGNEPLPRLYLFADESAADGMGPAAAVGLRCSQDFLAL